MNEEFIDPFEEQLRVLPMGEAPKGLRDVTLAAVHRQLAAARWERRIARTTVLLLLLGVALNVRFDTDQENRSEVDMASKSMPENIIEVGVSVAEVTDSETGSRFAKRMANLVGSQMTRQQVIALEQAIQNRFALPSSSRKSG
jgi:hypothetical protein